MKCGKKRLSASTTVQTAIKRKKNIYITCTTINMRNFITILIGIYLNWIYTWQTYMNDLVSGWAGPQINRVIKLYILIHRTYSSGTHKKNNMRKFVTLLIVHPLGLTLYRSLFVQNVWLQVQRPWSKLSYELWFVENGSVLPEILLFNYLSVPKCTIVCLCIF